MSYRDQLDGSDAEPFMAKETVGATLIGTVIDTDSYESQFGTVDLFGGLVQP